MTRIQSIALTPEQLDAMNDPRGDWLPPLTPDQGRFLKTCPSDHVTTVFGGTLMQVPAERMAAAMEVAFKEAAKSAIRELGLDGDVYSEQIANIACESPELGQAFLRVTVSSCDGRQSTGVGMIPDPRAQ